MPGVLTSSIPIFPRPASTSPNRPQRTCGVFTMTRLCTIQRRCSSCAPWWAATISSWVPITPFRWPILIRCASMPRQSSAPLILPLWPEEMRRHCFICKGNRQCNLLDGLCCVRWLHGFLPHLILLPTVLPPPAEGLVDRNERGHRACFTHG